MARDDRGGLTVLTDAMRLVEGEDDGEEPAAAGATRVVPVEIRCWLTTSQLADLKSRLGTACARAVDLAVRQGFPGSVAGDDALGLLEQLSGFPQATPGPRSWRGLKISLHTSIRPHAAGEQMTQFPQRHPLGYQSPVSSSSLT